MTAARRLKFRIILIAYGFAPLVGRTILDILMKVQVLHPTVFLGTMPMFNAFRNLDNGSRREFNGGFIPLLIPSLTRNTDKHLDCTVMDVPVIPATRLEGHIVVAAIQRSQVALTGEILCISVIGLAQRKGQFFIILNSHILMCLILAAPDSECNRQKKQYSFHYFRCSLKKASILS